MLHRLTIHDHRLLAALARREAPGWLDRMLRMTTHAGGATATIAGSLLLLALPGTQQKRGRLRLIISPDGADGSLCVHQDARVFAGLFDGDEAQRFALPAKLFAYVHVARGALEVNGQRLAAGDAVKLRNVREVSFAKGEQAEVLLFDLRPNETPRY